MNGKDKCRILRQIRQQIAQENDISLITEECGFKGECRGTCPRCEAELQYLESQLEKRRSLNKKIVLAGISAGMVLSLTGCRAVDAIVDVCFPLSGVMPPQTEESLLMGEIVELPTPSSQAETLTGALIPEEYLDAESASPSEPGIKAAESGAAVN